MADKLAYAHPSVRRRNPELFSEETKPKAKKGRPEGELVDEILEHLKARGYLCTHFRPARTAKGWVTPLQGDAGYVDITAVGHSRLIAIEAKTDGNEPRPEQLDWLRELARVPGVTALVITPSSWPVLKEIL